MRLSVCSVSEPLWRSEIPGLQHVAPRYVDQVEAVEQQGLGQSSIGAKIEGDIAVERLRHQLQLLLPAREISLQRHLWYVVRDVADRPADDEFGLDELPRRILPGA